MREDHRYFVCLISQLPNSNELRVLDFGCGRGDVVQELRELKIDCYGADVFYDGASYDELRESESYRSGIIRELGDGDVIPFPDQFFDVIISNAVFEHIEDKQRALQQLERVLKPGGTMFHHFPTLEVILEGHMAIPCAHWFQAGKLRFAFVAGLRCMGLGNYKQRGESIFEWTRRKLDWIDKYCFYENSNYYNKLFSEYALVHREIDYMRFRARNIPVLRGVLKIPLLSRVFGVLYRRIFCTTIELCAAGGTDSSISSTSKCNQKYKSPLEQ